MTIKEYEALWKDIPPCPFVVGDRVTFKDDAFTHDHGGWVFAQVLLRKRKVPFLTITKVDDIYIYFKEVQDMIDFPAGGISYVPFKLINT